MLLLSPRPPHLRQIVMAPNVGPSNSGDIITLIKDKLCGTRFHRYRWFCADRYASSHAEQPQLPIHQAVEIQIDEGQYGIGHRLELPVDIVLVINR